MPESFSNSDGCRPPPSGKSLLGQSYGQQTFGVLWPDAQRFRGTGRAALSVLSQSARDMVHSWLSPRPKMRFRRAAQSSLVRMRLRIGATESFSSWPGAILAYSLAECYEVTNDERDLNTVMEYGERWMKKHHGKELPNSDYIANGRVMLWLHRVTGEEQFFDEAHRMATYFGELPRSSTGLIPYRSVALNQIYVDTLGLVVPFVADYLALVPDQSLMSQTLHQVNSFICRAEDSHSRLPYHAFNDVTGEKLGAVGWGRGVGWLLFGLGELFRSDYGQKACNATLANAFSILSDRVCEFQRTDGSFSWLLQGIDGPADASGSGLIYCGLESGALTGVLTSRSISQALFRALENITSQGKEGAQAALSSAECGGLGIYPQTYGIYPWGVAPNILALSRYLRMFNTRDAMSSSGG